MQEDGFLQHFIEILYMAKFMQMKKILLVLPLPEMAVLGRKYSTLRKKKCSPRSGNSSTLSRRADLKQKDKKDNFVFTKTSARNIFRVAVTAQKMKFSIKNLFDKFEQIRRFMRIFSNLPKKSITKNFIFCA